MNNPFTVQQNSAFLWENPTISATDEWLASLQQPSELHSQKTRLASSDCMNVVLGRGFNRFTASIRNCALHNLKAHPLPARPLQTAIRVQKIASLSALRPLLGWWSCSSTVAATSLYKQRLAWLESINSPNAQQLLVIHYSIASKQRLTTYRCFSPFAEAYLYHPVGDYHPFVIRYGDSFIDSYQFGGQMIAVLSGNTDELPNSINELCGQYTCIKTLIKHLTAMREHFSALLGLYIIGGAEVTGLDLLDLLNSFPEKIYPETGDPTIFSVGVTPYEELDCYPNFYPGICKFNYPHYLKLLQTIDDLKTTKHLPKDHFTLIKKIQQMANAPDVG